LISDETVIWDYSTHILRLRCLVWERFYPV
jgi:hypothetical protein